MKIAYCGYDFFHACLADLVKNGHVLSELFTWPADNHYDFNDNVLSLAQDAGARITLSAISVVDLERLRGNGIEAIVSAAYPYKIPPWQGYVKYALNVHPSLLPNGRGRWPLPWVILKNLDRSGVSIHEVSESWDSGDLLAQDSFPISSRETLESLSLRSQLLARRLLSNVMSDIENCWRNKQAQLGGSVWPMPKARDRTISFDLPVLEIDRIVRAFSKFEPFLFLDKIRYFVRRVDVWQEAHSITPGTLVLKSNRECVYAARDGFVALAQYQRADSDET